MINEIKNIDCIQGLKKLPDESINCCVTSPPYYGLRDYGTSGQIGLEDSPEDFVQKMVEVFSEVKRVLRKDGTLWLNLGDSYNAYKANTGDTPFSGNVGRPVSKKGLVTTQLKVKDLIGIPWMVAFALRSAGWYLRQDIIWHKPNPMPESVTDRCTKSHEYIFLLSKTQKYYYNHDEIKQPLAASSLTDRRFINGDFIESRPDRGFFGAASKGAGFLKTDESGANKRSVWTVTTKPFSEAHFATFPEDLIVDCIKAGCPEGGIVLDPFMGAGTTALVARKLGRNFTGFELNQEYIKIADKRLKKELGMFY